MSRESVISSLQLFLFIFFANIATVVFFVPGEITKIVGQDSWMAILIGTFLAALFVYYPLVDLGINHPDKTIVQYSQVVMGKPLGILVGLLFLYYFFQLHCWTLREFSGMFVTLMPETPEIVFMILMTTLMAYAVYTGPEVIGRCAEFVFPIGFFFFLLALALSLSKVNFTHLLPVHEYVLPDYLHASIPSLDWLSLGFVVGMFIPLLNDKKKVKQTVLSAIVFSGLILTTVTVVTIAVFGSGQLENLTFPFLSLARYGESQIQAVVMVYWITWVFIRGTVFTYSTMAGLQQLLNLPGYRWFIIPEGILAVAYSNYQYTSFMEMSRLFASAHFFYISFSVMLPFVLWVVFRIRGINSYLFKFFVKE